MPTVLQNFLIEEVEAEEKPVTGLPIWPKNTLLGRFTNFVNLLDMAAVSIPSSLIKHPDLSQQSDCKPFYLRLVQKVLVSTDLAGLNIR